MPVIQPLEKHGGAGEGASAHGEETNANNGGSVGGGSRRGSARMHYTLGRSAVVLAWPMRPFANMLCALTLTLVILFALFVGHAPAGDHEQNYLMFSHVSIMIFVGFGFLMTFLRRYSMAAIGLNFIASVLVMLEAILIVGALASAEHADLRRDLQFIKLDVAMLVQGLFAAAAGMISFGAVLGKASPTQVLLLLALEVPLYALNAVLCFEGVFVPMGAIDAGGAIVIHTMGAYFGLAASLRMFRDRDELGASHAKNAASYASNVSSMVGTIFLWILWPSFNGIFTGEARTVAIVNTVLSISGATLATFALSARVFGDKLDMVLVQNATLAGGVAMGAVPHLPLSPGVALAIGCAAGALSCTGFSLVGPWLEARIGLKDTCGVHALHGMPGVLGSLVGAVALAAMPQHAAAPGAAGAEVLALLVTLAIAILGGLACGELVSRVDAVPDAHDRYDLAFEDAALIQCDREPDEELTRARAVHDTKPPAHPAPPLAASAVAGG